MSAWLLNPNNVSHPAQTTRLILARRRIEVQVVLAEAAAAVEIEPGFASLTRERVDAILLFGDTFFAQQL